MAKIRTIKPELFRHEALFELEQEYLLPLRLAFAGLFVCCDREGRFRWRPRQLKLDILPYDNIDFEEILNALHSKDFIAKYEKDGEQYGYIPSWHRHQTINTREPESKLPDPNMCTHMHACVKQGAPHATSVQVQTHGITEPIPAQAIPNQEQVEAKQTNTLNSQELDLKNSSVVAESSYKPAIEADVKLFTSPDMCTHVRACAEQGAVQATQVHAHLEVEVEMEMEMEVEGNGSGKELSAELPSNTMLDEPQPHTQSVVTITLNNNTEFPIFQNQIDEWQELYSPVNVLQTLKLIREWNMVNVKRRKTKSGILRHITGWLANEKNRGGIRAPPSTYSSALTRNNALQSHNLSVAEQWLKNQEPKIIEGEILL